MKLTHRKYCACATCVGAPIDDGTLVKGVSYEYDGREYLAESIKWVAGEGWWVYYMSLNGATLLRLPLTVWNTRVDRDQS